MSTDPYLPPERRREILSEYGQHFGLEFFVETGTANGDTIAALMPRFKHLYTIEVGKAQWQAARDRFRGRHVTCIHGDSAEKISLVLAELGDKPALFWLDGHFCGGDRADKDTPIVEEMAAIFASGIPHVVLIDDARLFEGMSHYGEHDWPHIDQIRVMASENGYDYECVDDIIRLTPATE